MQLRKTITCVHWPMVDGLDNRSGTYSTLPMTCLSGSRHQRMTALFCRHHYHPRCTEQSWIRVRNVSIHAFHLHPEIKHSMFIVVSIFVFILVTCMLCIHTYIRFWGDSKCTRVPHLGRSSTGLPKTKNRFIPSTPPDGSHSSLVQSQSGPAWVQKSPCKKK